MEENVRTLCRYTWEGSDDDLLAEFIGIRSDYSGSLLGGVRVVRPRATPDAAEPALPEDP